MSFRIFKTALLSLVVALLMGLAGCTGAGVDTGGTGEARNENFECYGPDGFQIGNTVVYSVKAPNGYLTDNQADAADFAVKKFTDGTFQNGEMVQVFGRGVGTEFEKTSAFFELFDASGHLNTNGLNSAVADVNDQINQAESTAQPPMNVMPHDQGITYFRFVRQRQ